MKRDIWFVKNGEIIQGGIIININYEIPFSSTNPVSCRDFWQVAWEQVKWDKHQDRPRAVINGPLKLGKIKMSPNNI